jgi:hypothetical protein
MSRIPPIPSQSENKVYLLIAFIRKNKKTGKRNRRKGSIKMNKGKDEKERKST